MSGLPRSAKVIKSDLLAALEHAGDRRLEEHQFKRARRSLSYRRTVGPATHELHFDADFWPYYQPGAEFHLIPRFSLSLPRVTDKALELVGGNARLLDDAPDIILNQPVELTAPKRLRQRLFAKGRNEMEERISETIDIVEKWTLPLLDELSTPADLIAADTLHVPPIVRQHRWTVFVAAAMVLGDRADAARLLVEERLGATGLRRRFTTVFENLSTAS